MQKIKILLFLVMSAVYSQAALSAITADNTEFLHPDKAFIPTIQQDNSNIRISWEIEKGYYLYMGMFKFTTDNDQVKIINIKMPEGQKKHDEFFGDVDVYYLKTHADLEIQDNSLPFNLLVTYQGCAEAGLCYPPIIKEFNISSLSQDEFELHKLNYVGDQTQISQSLNDKSILSNIILFLLAGVLLAFTPCVFPMIPILTGIIIGQGNKISTKRSFFLSLTYVLSMAITYSILGALIAMSGSNIQADIQSPYIITSFAMLFIILGLSMFNIINIQMPKFIQNSMTSTSNRQKSGTFYGVAAMGSLSALIVGPCVTAPLIGALTYIATTKDYIIGGSALFALGLGMGLPLLILGTSANKFIKKYGSYLEITNKIFGILFLIVAIWLIERIVSIEVSAYTWAALSLLILFLINKKSTSRKNMFVKTFSIILMAYFSLQIIGGNKNSNFNPILSFINKPVTLEFTKLKKSEELFASIKKSNQITMVDLYADWCVACKELDKYTFSDENVLVFLKKMNLVKFDITETTKDNTNLLKKYNLFGPPAILFFNENGDEIKDLRIVGFIGADSFIKVIKQLNI